MLTARVSGEPGRGGARTFPLAWRSFILAKRSRKWLFKFIERQVRSVTKGPARVADCGYLLSYPRSGNHWVRYVLESISGYSTLGDREGTGHRHTGLWIDTPIRVKISMPGVRRFAIAIKRHHVRQGDTTTAPLVFLVRRPHLAIISHHSAHLSEANIIAEAADRFVKLCITVDTWRGPTKVIFYEDFTANDKQTFGAAVEELMAGFNLVSFAAQLRTFLNHLEHHRARSYLSLEREPQSTKIDWGSANAREAAGIVEARLAASSVHSKTLRDIKARYSGSK
jgi:hypothetical protein